MLSNIITKPGCTINIIGQRCSGKTVLLDWLMDNYLANLHSQVYVFDTAYMIEQAETDTDHVHHRVLEELPDLCRNLRSWSTQERSDGICIIVNVAGGRLDDDQKEALERFVCMGEYWNVTVVFVSQPVERRFFADLSDMRGVQALRQWQDQGPCISFVLAHGGFHITRLLKGFDLVQDPTQLPPCWINSPDMRYHALVVLDGVIIGTKQVPYTAAAAAAEGWEDDDLPDVEDFESEFRYQEE